MSNESKTLEKEAQAQAEARQPWTPVGWET